MSPIDIKDKVLSLEIRGYQFTNEDNGELVEYKRVVATVLLDGIEEEYELKAKTKDAYTLLRLADSLK